MNTNCPLCKKPFKSNELLVKIEMAQVDEGYVQSVRIPAIQNAHALCPNVSINRRSSDK